MRVVLKPTTFKQDEILFRAFSPGGTSLASDQDFIAAETADQVVAQGGLGTLSAIDLSKKLAGKTAFVRPDIDEMSEGLSGRALAPRSRDDVPADLPDVHRSRAPIRKRSAPLTGQLKAALANRQALPDAAFEDALNAALTQNHLRARPLTRELVAQMNLDKSLAFYKDRFADASDFTFVFVGSFDLPTIKPLVERYLGSLPALHRKEAGEDVGIRPPAGVVEKQVSKGSDAQEPGRRRVHRAVPEQPDEPPDRPGDGRTRSAGNLQRVLREDLGGTYGVSVVPEFTKRPTEEYRADDHLRLRSGAHAGSRQGAVRGRSTSSGRTGRARARSPTRRRRCGATSRPTAGRTATC